MSHKEAFATTKVPHATAEAIWNKATVLIGEENAVVVAPGCGPKDKMVKSKSGTVPHLVTATKYKCDDKCPQYKSLSICSHTVAAAQFNSEVKEFMEWYRKKHGNHQPRFTQLAVHDMPAAAGRKGGKLPKKRANHSYVSTNENRIPLKCSQRVNIDSESASNGSPCISQQPTTNYVTNSHVSNVTVPNLPVSPFPSYNMPTPLYPYYSSQSFGIGGAVPMAVFPSTPSPLPIPQSGPTGVNLSALSNPVFQPSYPLSPSLPTDNTFIVCFKFGNVSVCSGCRCNFGQNDDIVIKHPEFRSYSSPITGHPTSKFGNAPYKNEMSEAEVACSKS